MLDAGITTLMLRGLPPNLKRGMLLQLLSAEGAGRYNLVYVPYDKIANRPMSSAIVNFTDHESARKVYGFFESLRLETNWSLHITPATVQGFEANLALIAASSGSGFSTASVPLFFWGCFCAWCCNYPAQVARRTYCYTTPAV